MSRLLSLLRRGRWTLAAALGTAALLAPLAALAGPATAASPARAAAPAPGASTAADDLPDGWTSTKWGPLGPADRDLLAGVRRAGLWEMPAGQMAVEKGQSKRVREVGEIIAEQHATLDSQVREVADKLGEQLPSQPTAEQQGWLDEMEKAEGAAFDEVFADRLRAAHGKVFSLIASVRAGTRNELVRDFSEVANKAVMTHMDLLESTDQVDYAQLPTPVGVAATGTTTVDTSQLSPAEAAIAADQKAKAQDVLHRGDKRRADGPVMQPKSFDVGTVGTLVIWVVLLSALAVGATLAYRAVRAG